MEDTGELISAREESEPSPKMIKLDGHEDGTKCVVCKLSAVTDSSILLRCLHSVCTVDCSEKVILEDAGCPVCGKAFLDLRTQTEPNYLFRIEASRKLCTYCIPPSGGTRPPVSHVCGTCGVFLCLECARCHTNMRIMAGHTLLPYDGSPEKIVGNDLHKHVLCYNSSGHASSVRYCLKCSGLHCHECSKQEHEGHPIKFLSDVVNNLKGELSGALPSVAIWMKQFGAMDNLKNDGGDFPLDYVSLRSLRSQVLTIKERITPELKIATQAVADRLIADCSGYIEKTKQYHDKMMALGAEIEHFQENFPELLKAPPIVQMQSAVRLLTRINYIECQILEAICPSCGVEAIEKMSMENVTECQQDFDNYLNEAFEIRSAKPETRE